MDLDAAYQISNDTYVDARSGVLKNRLGLTDPDALEAAEEDITYAAIAALLAEQPYQLEQIDFETLRDIHRRVFGRIYAWAGELRTVEISKGNTRFAFSQWLQRAADNFGLPLSTFVLKAAQQVADSGELVIKADLTPTPWLAAQIEQAGTEEPEATFDLPRDRDAMDAYLGALVGE